MLQKLQQTVVIQFPILVSVMVLKVRALPAQLLPAIRLVAVHQLILRAILLPRRAVQLLLQRIRLLPQLRLILQLSHQVCTLMEELMVECVILNATLIVMIAS